MTGYDVVTSEGETAGTVVGETADSVVIEDGTLFRSRYAIPRVFVVVDEDARVVRTTIAKRMIEESPKLSDDVGDAAIARYYGLAAGGSSPATEGYGALNPDDPAMGAELEELAAGLEPAASARARQREHPDEVEPRRPSDPRTTPAPEHYGRRQVY